MIRSIKILLFTFLFPVILVSQNIKRVEGTAQVKIEGNMTKEQAKQKAKELAMIKAIENSFGTYVEQSTDIDVRDGKVSYNIIGNTQVLGEFVQTDKPSFKETVRKVKVNGNIIYETWIECIISGKARKATPKANIKIQTLNCPAIECRTEDYYSGEPMYLYFKSPVNGYLSVFLKEEKVVYRLLPYTNMDGQFLKSVPVEADKEYILFDPNRNYFNNNIPDLLEVFTNKKKERNELIIVFAEKEYTKPLLNEDSEFSEYKEDYRLPKSTNFGSFEEWVSENKAYMNSFMTRNLNIEIVNK